MSELNELIASSSVHAYNSGIEQGKQLERERIVALVETWLDDDQGDLRQIIQTIKGEK
jgi:predicted O-linked N-acetylglucosamine transferase (SPINDLY family)